MSICPVQGVMSAWHEKSHGLDTTTQGQCTQSSIRRPCPLGASRRSPHSLEPVWSSQDVLEGQMPGRMA